MGTDIRKIHIKGTTKHSSKVVLAILSTISAIIVFNNLIANLFTNLFVTPILSHIGQTTPNDIIFFLITCYIVASAAINWRKYIPGSKLSIMLIFIAIYYCVYRNSSYWDFTAFRNLSSFNYADVLIVLAVMRVLTHISIKKNKEQPVNLFLNDEPIKSKKADLLRYSSYASRLSKWLEESTFSSSFAIGITGKWGSGKTSLINIIKENLSEKPFIQIDFNPWLSSSNTIITEEFFNLMEEAISPFHKSMTRMISQYSHKLISIDPSGSLGGIASFFTQDGHTESISHLQTRINQAISQIGKKIVVYIDDIDRLDTSEIADIIRLVRSTANFRNFFFVLAYDREYLVAALKSINPVNHQKYLEKIIQFEVSMPYVPRHLFEDHFFKKLKERLPAGYYKSEIDPIATRSFMYTSFSLGDWLKSMRDVTLLANSVLFNLNKLKGEVLFNEFLFVEILRINYQEVFSEFHQNTFEYIQQQINRNTGYRLKKEKDKLSIELWLKRQERYSDREIKRITGLLTALFPEHGPAYFSDQSGSHLSIANPERFHNYFSYSLIEGTLSENSFRAARDGSLKSFQNALANWVDEGYRNEVVKRLKQVTTYQDQNDFEKVIRAILFLADYEYTIDSEKQRKVGYHFDDLAIKLWRGVNTPGEIDNEKIDSSEFVRSIFANASPPYESESELIRHLIESRRNANTLSIGELHGFIKTYFIKYAESLQSFDLRIWHLWHTLKKASRALDESLDDNLKITAGECNSLLNDFGINVDLKGYLESMIDIETWERKTYAIHSSVRDRFETWKGLRDWLKGNTKKDPKAVAELLGLFEDFEATKFKKYVPYTFTYLNPHIRY